MSEVKLAGKRVLLREDLNVPMSAGQIADDTRIKAALPTIRAALGARARLMIVSHLGRPTEGEYDPALSLEPVAARLAELLGQPVRLAKDWLDGVELGDGEAVLCENVRFAVGEKKNDDDLARRMAALCDVYVNDAFATAHRAQASTYGVAKYAPVACAGPLLTAEMDALRHVVHNPARPLLAVVGGAKVSTKLKILESLSKTVDGLIVGGGISNTFLKAAGYNIGNSLFEPDLVDTARELMQQARERNAEIPLPSDVFCAREFSETAEAVLKPVSALGDGDMIMDIGPETAARYTELLQHAGTIVWNGPLGVFEFEQFSAGTRKLAEAIAASGAYSIAGGGDTIAAIAKFKVADHISYISTGGGAFLEFLEGRTLPAVAILEEHARARPGSTHPSEGY